MAQRKTWSHHIFDDACGAGCRGREDFVALLDVPPCVASLRAIPIWMRVVGRIARRLRRLREGAYDLASGCMACFPQDGRHPQFELPYEANLDAVPSRGNLQVPRVLVGGWWAATGLELPLDGFTTCGFLHHECLCVRLRQAMPKAIDHVQAHSVPLP